VGFRFPYIILHHAKQDLADRRVCLASLQYQLIGESEEKGTGRTVESYAGQRMSEEERITLQLIIFI
jgi:hypothetical protein